jgi:hypothetical protein
MIGLDSLFETVTVPRTDGKETLSQMKALVDQSAIKIVDVRQRAGQVTIVFRRLAPAL